MSGLRGYPFYSIQGTKSLMIDITIRRLIMANKNVKFKPLSNRVVIEPMEDNEQMSAGGIYIPDTAKEKPQGIVVFA